MAKGPFNQVFPKILVQFLEETRKGQIDYIEAIKDNMIMPQKLTILHYFSSLNNPEALIKAFKLGTPYNSDNKKKSPLEYALDRESIESVDVIIGSYFENNLDVKDFFSKKNTIMRLINNQPLKLYVIFENAVETLEDDVPYFGCIKDGQDLKFVESKNLSLSQEDLDELVTTNKS